MNTEETITIEKTDEEQENPEVIIDSLFVQQDESIQNEFEEVPQKSEHVVDPDDFALYKKYLG